MRMTSKMNVLIAATVAATFLLTGCAMSMSSAQTPASASSGSGAVVATGSDADITFA